MTAQSVEGYISRHTDMIHTSLRFYFLGVTASTVAVGQLVPTFEAVFLIFKFCHQISHFFAASSASPQGNGGAFFTPPSAHSHVFTNLLEMWSTVV